MSSIIVGLQLKKAREFFQLTAAEAAKKINVSPQEIMRWEKEDAIPGLSQLEALAKLYGREIDYFLKETPAPPSAVEFRGKPGQTFKNLSPESKIALARFDELCRSAIEFEKLLGKKREIKFPKIKFSETTKNLAQHVRDEFNCYDKPVTNLKELLASFGTRIFELPVPGDEVSGFSYWHDKYGPCILLNAKDTKARRNFTLAHELSHLLHKDGSSLCYVALEHPSTHGSKEYHADQFAAEFLLPASSVQEDYGKKNLSATPTENELLPLAYKWGVSVQALGYRLESLDLIKKGHTNKLLEPKPHFRRSKTSTPTWERQLGKQFVQTSLEAYHKQLISISKLAHTLGIPIRKAMEIAEPQR